MLAKNFFKVHVVVGILEFLYMRWIKILKLVEPLVMENRTYSFYFITPEYSDYMQKHTKLLEQWDHIIVKILATVTWLDDY